MKLLTALIVVAVLFCVPGSCAAQENDGPLTPPATETTAGVQVPEGMEIIQIGGSGQLIVPKGARTRKVGAQIIVEGTKEYMARNISDMDERIRALEQTVGELMAEIDILKAQHEKKDAGTGDGTAKIVK